MKLPRTILIAAFGLAAAVWLQPAAVPQDQTVGRCVVSIPTQWGTFRGAAQGYGLVFEDNAGTLRFMNQMPCGLEGAPIVSLEVRRK